MNIKPIRKMNDLIAGLGLLGLGLYIIFTDKIIYGVVGETRGGPLVQPDVYVRMIGGFIAFFSVVLIIKAINWTRAEKVTPFHFVLMPHIVLCVAGLIVYVLVLKIIGFVVSTFLLNVFLTCLFLHKERIGEGKPPLTRKDIIRTLCFVALYSVILVAFVYCLFTYVMYVDLP